MIQSHLVPDLPATLLHRVHGPVDLPQAEAGVTEALALAQQLIGEQGVIHLLLDLRGMDFQRLAARKVWNEGFVRHPLLVDHAGFVAIVADDLPHVRAEQAVMEGERLRFFFDLAEGYNWLADQTRPSAARA
jgi:hypothetical protein